MDELIITILRSGTPLIYVTLAGVIAQRAGIWHLGLEGLMIAGACATIVGITLTGSVGIALLTAIAICILGSIIFWIVVEKLKANQIIAGLGLTGLGLGGTTLAVESIFGSQAAVNAPFGLPRIGDALGPLGISLGLYDTLSILVLALPLVIFVMWVLICRSRLGLQISACGEHPFAARSVGINPSAMRLLALSIGGILCALGGAELAAGSLQIFAQNMTAGRGFMGFAAVIFGASHPIGAVFAAMFFAIVGAIGIRAQLVFGDDIPHDLLLALPYMATVLGLWISAKIRGGTKAIAGFGELRDN